MLRPEVKGGRPTRRARNLGQIECSRGEGRPAGGALALAQPRRTVAAVSSFVSAAPPKSQCSRQEAHKHRHTSAKSRAQPRLHATNLWACGLAGDSTGASRADAGPPAISPLLPAIIFAEMAVVGATSTSSGNWRDSQAQEMHTLLIALVASVPASAFVTPGPMLASARKIGLRACAASAHGAMRSEAYRIANDGCWAGFQAEFSVSGELKAVPDRFLTDGQIEWGDLPAALELLTTEKSGQRRFVLLYPEDGCACENLFGELSESSLDLGALGGDAPCFTCDDPPGDGGPLWYLRTIVSTGADQRTRVSLRYDAEQRSLGPSTAIRVALERRWATAPDALVIPMSLKRSGGRSGLDSTTVRGMMGSARCFAEVPVTAAEAEAGRGDLVLPGGVRVVIDPETGELCVKVGGRSVSRSFSGGSVTVTCA